MVSDHELLTRGHRIMIPAASMVAVCTFAKRELDNAADDDSEPIDAAWLDKADFGMLPGDNGAPPFPWRPVGREDLTCGVVWYNNEWQFMLEDHECDKTIMIKVVTTRGDVRRLFYALGG